MLLHAAACCMLHAACCTLHAACCMLHAARCNDNRSGSFRSLNCDTINGAAFLCNIVTWSGGFVASTVLPWIVQRSTVKISTDLVVFVATTVISLLFWPSTAISSAALKICTVQTVIASIVEPSIVIFSTDLMVFVASIVIQIADYRMQTIDCRL